MKKLFLSAAVVMSTLTFAQQFGVKAGMNVSSLSEDSNLSDQGSKIGFNAGVFANIPIAASFSVQPELIYTQYGEKYDYTVPSTIITNATRSPGAMNLYYVSLPVMLEYNVTPSFYLEAGIEFGLLVSATDKSMNETTGETLPESNIYKDSLNCFNFRAG